MHLKSCPKLVRSELRVDASGVQQGALLRSRLPLTVISTNTLRANTNNHPISTGVASLRLKVSPGTPLQLLPPTVGCENDALHLTTPEAADAPLDIWTVIKPGHVREKIAMFASDGQSSGGAAEQTPPACQGHAPSSGPTRAAKAKGSWEENCSAKRRRRSGNNTRQETQQSTHKTSPWRADGTQQAGGVRRAGEAGTGEGEEQKVSVVEMVAFLEQRVSERQPDAKPVLTLQRSSASITLSRAPPPEPRDSAQAEGEEPESIKVSDMVARLESECLRRRTEGDLSRSNSLRRSVGRVLLATADQSSASCPARCQPAAQSPVTSSLQGTGSVSGDPISCSQTLPAPTLTPPPSQASPVLPQAEETLEKATPPHCEEAEPVPGLLFLSSASEAQPSSDSAPPLLDLEPCLHHRATCELETRPLIPVSAQSSQSERRMLWRSESLHQDPVSGSVVAVGRRASVSQDFLLMRQRLQQLLEPRPYLTVLPHHLLVKIFLLLPTQSLAALKCTCHYFHFLIDTYGVRPADSLWVSDPRYRDDPCKQCKKRYGRGDVSLCRWHHKPYCQALPYGPGYWMCCHGARRDTPGCNVGLHDNRWVPSFHSINAPIYRGRRHDD